ncbi:hypothetical protein KC357_g243 [Hortaea werneckii]|nr:hypothetical protein KC357_g243 [Hortaea werneckii]
MLFGGRRSRYGVLARKSWSQMLKRVLRTIVIHRWIVRREGCEGGLNRSGFSSTRGLGGGDVDECRREGKRRRCWSCLECS